MAPTAVKLGPATPGQPPVATTSKRLTPKKLIHGILVFCGVLYLLHISASMLPGGPRPAQLLSMSTSTHIVNAATQGAGDALPKGTAELLGRDMPVETVPADQTATTPTLEDVEADPTTVTTPTPEPAAVPTDEEQAAVEDMTERLEEEQQRLATGQPVDPPASERAAFVAGAAEDMDATPAPSSSPEPTPAPSQLPALPSPGPRRQVPPPKPIGFIPKSYTCNARRALRTVLSEVLHGRPDYMNVYRNAFKAQDNSQTAFGVTVATHLTPDRLDSLVRLTKLWRGPVSATVHLCKETDYTLLKEAVSRSAELRKYATIHVLIGNTHFIPVNTMRNVAIEGVTSPYVFVIDVETAPSMPMKHMSAQVAATVKLLRPTNTTLLVMPAFRLRAVVDASGSDPMFAQHLQVWPVPKLSVAELWRHGRILPRAVKFPNSSAVALPEWMDATRAYRLQYQPKSEPVFVAATDALHSVMFDERFIGHGNNRYTQAFETFAAGWEFLALPSVWVLDTPRSTNHAIDPLQDYKTANFLREVVDKYQVQCTSAPAVPCWWQTETERLSEATVLPKTEPYPLTIVPAITPPPAVPLTTCSAYSELLSKGLKLKELPVERYKLATHMNYRTPIVPRLPKATPDPQRPRPAAQASLVSAMFKAMGSRMPDITLTTQLTINRLPMLLGLVKRWQGPVSAVVHVCDAAELREVNRFFDAEPLLQRFVRLHVLVGSTTFIPINILRNAAINGTETEWVFVLDVDARTSGTAAQFAADLFEAALDGAVDGQPVFHTAYAVPALAWTHRKGMSYWKEHDGGTGGADAVDKAQLASQYNSHLVEQMHAQLRGYRIDFQQWFSGDRSLSFQYLSKAENYFIARKQDVILFDERFMGRGLNKVVLAFAMYWDGWEFRALSRSWVLDTPHEVQAGVSNARHDPMNPQHLRAYLLDLFAKHKVTCPVGVHCWWDTLATTWLIGVQNMELNLQRKGWKVDGTFSPPPKRRHLRA